MLRYFINNIEVRQDYYPIYDRGWTQRAVAICTDGDQAQRIVDLLNASDEKRKEPR